MVDHTIGTWEVKRTKKIHIRNKVKEGKSFGNVLKRKEGRSLEKGVSIKLEKFNIAEKKLFFWTKLKLILFKWTEIEFQNWTEICTLKLSSNEQGVNQIFLFYKPNLEKII